MRRSAALGLAALAHAAAFAAPATYRFDPNHSFVTFELQHFGTSTLRGRFGPLQGTAVLDPVARTGQVWLRVPTAAVSTGVAPLDHRLHEADMLASSENPEAFFVAERFAFDGPTLREVRGEFTLRGVSRPLSLRALRFRCGPHPQLPREVCGGDFEAQLKRSDYGITFGLPLVADRVHLLIQVEAIRDQ
jgi:polyisoprenoid-binding protein YceI